MSKETKDKVDPRLRILMIEDLSSDAELAQREISNNGIEFVCQVVDNKKDFLNNLIKFKPDIILSDYMLPHFDGMRALRLSKETDPMIPFIIITGSTNEETAVECMKAGADDYVIKEHISRLGPAVKSALAKKKNEKALLESERKVRLIADNIDEVVWMIAVGSYQIAYLSPSFEKIWGISNEQVTANSELFFASIHPDDYPNVVNDFRFNESSKPFEHEFRIIRPDKSIRWIRSRGYPVYDNANSITHFVGVSLDITLRKQYEYTLLEAKDKAEEMNRLKSNFLANMSHELRTPMIGILGYSEILKNELENPEHKEMINTIHASGIRLTNTLNLILDLSRIESGLFKLKVKKINIAEFILNKIKVFEGAAKNKNLTLTTSVLNDNVISSLDDRLLDEIVNNFMNNAIKFTRVGSITVEISSETKDNKFWSVIRFTDTGIGIPKESQQIIFEEFRQVSEGYSRLYEGTGLGLSITKRSIELMDGNVSVESKVGTGTTFTVRFPLASPS